ncbi:NADH-quinone oxidoreductase subunit C [Paenibacillaceae bacterium WGS1546]|uniref:NADH-quinone oxidoreductase subunit C n=1 Tax=Cohnella sp. WGS1546 TaxID=3366810 RepID=UPI00372D2CEB
MSEENKQRPEGEESLAEAKPETPAATPEAQPETAKAEAEAAAEPAAEAKAETPTQAPATEPAAPEAAQQQQPASAAPPAAEGGEAPPPRRKETDEEKAARRKAALEAREAAKAAAAQAAAKAAQAGSAAPGAAKASGDGASAGEEQPPKPSSPNQPRLDRTVALLRELVAEDAVEEAYINEANDHLPTLVVKNERWEAAASLFRNHDELKCAYLRNVSGVDYETHMEVVYYPLNMDTRECYCVKVRTDRDQPRVRSVTPIWETANWNEREIYDLLGVDFPGHPNLRRIMMPDDWVGHPLRKDYVPLDPEV